MRKSSRASGSLGATPWLVVLLLSVVALPWYASESGLAALASGPAASALVEVFSGRMWPALDVAAILGVTIAVAARRPRLLTAAAVVGIAVLAGQMVTIGGNGWSSGIAAAVLPPIAGQPALGWGALVHVFALCMLLAHGLARQGWCKGEVYSPSPR